MMQLKKEKPHWGAHEIHHRLVRRPMTASDEIRQICDTHHLDLRDWNPPFGQRKISRRKAMIDRIADVVTAIAILIETTIVLAFFVGLGAIILKSFGVI